MDNKFMDRALGLAARGLYTTDPNPRVGCVVVAGEHIVGEGFHQRAGSPHAEVHALAQAQTRARGATVYVNLEPCAHHGRTPPCADALISARVARVVVAAIDPYSEVSGMGIEALRAAGISVTVGVREAAARALNQGYLMRLSQYRPWVRLKLAMSLDGRTALANGDSQWITGPAAREDVHQLRARSSAVMSSMRTVVADNASLNARLDSAEIVQPLRVILDGRFGLPQSATCLQIPGPLLVIGTQSAAAPAWMDGQIQTAKVGADSAGRPALDEVLRELAEHEVNELHVEAGATLGGALIQAGLVDELVIYVAPDLLGPDARGLLMLPALSSLQDRYRFDFVDVRRLGSDIKLTLVPVAST